MMNLSRIGKHTIHGFRSRIFNSNRLLSSDSKIRVRGEYKAREYQLLQLQPSSDENEEDEVLKPVAYLRSNGNLVWGANVTSKSLNDLTLCSPLLKRAMSDIEENAEQTQAMASLHGLCSWVCDEYISDSSQKENLAEYLKRQLQNKDVDVDLVYKAVTSIVTGIPRQGHSVVGQGTFRDGALGWECLAKDYAISNAKGAHECEFYRKHGALFVSVQQLVNTEPQYLSTAGGAMAAFMFAEV